MEGPIWGVTEQIVEQALKSMKVSKAPGPSGVKSYLIKAPGATGEKGLFQGCGPIEQARFQSSGPRVVPYRYIKVGEMS